MTPLVAAIPSAAAAHPPVRWACVAPARMPKNNNEPRFPSRSSPPKCGDPISENATTALCGWRAVRFICSKASAAFLITEPARPWRSTKMMRRVDNNKATRPLSFFGDLERIERIGCPFVGGFSRQAINIRGAGTPKVLYYYCNSAGRFVCSGRTFLSGRSHDV
jgi:hypothetical protein